MQNVITSSLATSYWVIFPINIYFERVDPYNLLTDLETA